MPPMPVITDVLRVAFNWTNDGGQNAVNVMHFVVPTIDKDAFVALIESTINPHQWEAVSVNARVRTLECVWLDGTDATKEYLLPNSTEWKGQTAGTPMPAVAQVIKLQSGFRGKSKNGRAFLPFISEGAFDSGSITGSIVALQQTNWTSFIAAMGTGGAYPCIASYLHAEAVYPLTALVESVCGTQRRRQSRLRV